MATRRPRKTYSEDFKRRVVAESFSASDSVSQVARRHDVNANLLFTWRKDPRFMPDGDTPAFLPVTIDAMPVSSLPHPSDQNPGHVTPPELGIWIGTDVRLAIKGVFDPDAIGTLIRSIRTSS